MLHKPKGQSTLFAIIGIVVVALVVLSFFLVKQHRKSPEVQKTVSFEQQVKNVQSYVQECSTEALKDALRTIGIQGGYYLTTEERKAITPFGTTAYVYDEKNILISQENMKLEIVKFLKVNIKKTCTFQPFKDLTITPGNFSATASLTSTKAILPASWPIDVTRETTSSLNAYTVEIESRLSAIHTFLNTILEDLETPQAYRIDRDLPEGMDLYIVQQDKEALYIIVDKQVPINDKPYRFFVKVKF